MGLDPGVLKNKHSTHTEDGEAAAQLHMNKGNVDTRVWKGRGAFERFYQQVCIVSAGSSFDLFKVVSVLSVPPPSLVRLESWNTTQLLLYTDSMEYRQLTVACFIALLLAQDKMLATPVMLAVIVVP